MDELVEKNVIIEKDITIEVLTDKLEDVVEMVSDCKVLEYIPYMKNMVKLAKVGQDYYADRLKRKLINFLYECQNMNESDIQKYLESYVKDEKKVGYYLVDELFNLDNDGKARLAGRLYKYCILNKLDIAVYHRILKAVHNCFLDDIVMLKKLGEERFVNNGSIIPEETGVELFNVGLLEEIGFDGGGFLQHELGGVIYKINENGKILRRLIY